MSERLATQDVFLPENLKVPEQGLVIYPEKYEIGGVYETYIREKGVFSPKNKLVRAALVIPKVPGDGWLTSGFQMYLTKINESGELVTRAAYTVDLRTHGVDGFSMGGVWGFHLFKVDDMGRQHHLKQGYGPRVKELEEVVGKHIGMLYFGVDLKLKEDVLKAAQEIAPSLMKFFDLYPDNPTATYFKDHFDYKLRVLRIRLEERRRGKEDIS